MPGVRPICRVGCPRPLYQQGSLSASAVCRHSTTPNTQRITYCRLPPRLLSAGLHCRRRAGGVRLRAQGHLHEGWKHRRLPQRLRRPGAWLITVVHVVASALNAHVCARDPEGLAPDGHVRGPCLLRRDLRRLQSVTYGTQDRGPAVQKQARRPTARRPIAACSYPPPDVPAPSPGGHGLQGVVIVPDIFGFGHKQVSSSRRLRTVARGVTPGQPPYDYTSQRCHWVGEGQWAGMRWAFGVACALPHDARLWICNRHMDSSG